MLITSPRSVRFGAVQLGGVHAVLIERAAMERVEEHDESGPFCVLADVVRQRTTVRIERTTEDASWPLVPEMNLGFQGELVVHAGSEGTDAGLARVSMEAVLVGVGYRVDARPGAQVLTFVAVSASGGTDPVTVMTGVRLEGA